MQVNASVESSYTHAPGVASHTAGPAGHPCTHAAPDPRHQPEFQGGGRHDTPPRKRRRGQAKRTKAVMGPGEQSP
ncbi:hypothetical protein IMZ48_24495 [Candidatus Bathyarchaeota archaeon]|nr:hypothetical protein [Candidatus Bathyarchaeota archaeon]